ncbi:ABC transporter transmembrane domain-containing protein [Polycladidibacter hongkongensis]|uniref:ABC transporter transmembrane domain-containing protein n=1 Tax=Polycladidibacter hongkongensis TaxID=1647556 RepID=UPI000832EB0B|nr:ABC transporter transmembrane domain-containing protein [Pseudovibrio hongkongensis]
MSKATSSAKQQSLSSLAALLPYLQKRKLRVFWAFVALIVAAAAALMLPVAARFMIDNGFAGDNPTLIQDYFLAIIAVTVVLAVSGSLRYYLVMTIGERVTADLRQDVFAHLLKLSPQFYDENKSGEILSRLTADTSLIKSAFGASASIALRQFLTLIGAVAMMVVTSPRLSAFVIIAIPFIVLPLIGFGRMVRNRARKAQDALAESASFATEALGGVRTLQSFTAETQTSEFFSNSAEEAYKAAQSATRARAFLIFLVIFVALTAVVGVLWSGAIAVIEGQMTGGELTQFVIFAVMAAGSLSELSNVWGELSQAAGAAGRLSEILSEKPQITAPAQPASLPTPAKGNIRFEGVSFAYPSAANAGITEQLSFSVEAGQTVAIVGPSGAGKSTLFQLLCRFYDPQAGRILVDDVDIKQLDPTHLRERIALVPQDPAIFAETVAQNIGIGRQTGNARDIQRAAAMAQAHEFIEKMNGAYASLIGERGVTLSGGQRQRIAIARAFLKDAPILLLDEATSALDAHSEKLVQKALDEVMVGRTTLVIAHRLATVLKADRILVMDKGEIVESGTHQQLVAKDGLYAKLARMQFSQQQDDISAAALP